jgi:hypothetical protein
VAVASVQACAESTVIDFADIDLMTTDSLQAFASNATACATQAQSLIPAVTGSPAAVDQAGFALNAVGPLALTARAKAGFSTAGLTPRWSPGTTRSSARCSRAARRSTRAAANPERH